MRRLGLERVPLVSFLELLAKRFAAESHEDPGSWLLSRMQNRSVFWDQRRCEKHGRESVTDEKRDGISWSEDQSLGERCCVSCLEVEKEGVGMFGGFGEQKRVNDCLSVLDKDLQEPHGPCAGTGC